MVWSDFKWFSSLLADFFSFDKTESNEGIDSVTILDRDAGLFGTENFSVMATHKTIWIVLLVKAPSHNACEVRKRVIKPNDCPTKTAVNSFSSS